ncbi:MAG: cytidylate kinase-like family protein [Geodermatophilaceae bacterium]|jgi:cytidylate kinase|nr:cytidylate kinase-like family protein [Geodermatophilaceae bacterium]
MGIVTISASYGALGSQIGPEVAEILGLPFVDRAIPASVAHKLGVSLDDAEAKDETVASGLWRVISSMALLPDLSGAGPLAATPAPDERAFREKTEQVLHEVAASTGGVILGRAGAVVLADIPDALHVRLDGPADARLARAQEYAEPDERIDMSILRENDAARIAYWRHFYRRDAHDCRQYHLVVDSTALPRNTVVDLIVTAARSRGVGQ